MENLKNIKRRWQVPRKSVLSIPHSIALLKEPGSLRSLVLPLVIEPSVLLLVSIVNFQEWLQMLMMCLHILVVHIDIIEIPFLLKDLFCCTCQNQRRFVRTACCFPCRPTALSCLCRQSFHAHLIFSFNSQAAVSRHFAARSLKSSA